MIRKLSWHEFDNAVDMLASLIADDVRQYTLPVITGEARGGLVVAVALSHRLRVPFKLTTERRDTREQLIWCDDVLERGNTALDALRLKPSLMVMWLTKGTLLNVFRYDEHRLSGHRGDFHGVPIVTGAVVNPHEWLVFPWEHAADVAEQQREYYARRDANA